MNPADETEYNAPRANYQCGDWNLVCPGGVGL